MTEKKERKTESSHQRTQFRIPARILAGFCAAAMLPGLCFSASYALADTGLMAGTGARQGSVRAAEGAEAFPDVGSGHWAYDAVQKLRHSGILSGYPDGSFRPSQKVTYGEFFKMICTEKVPEASAKPAGEHAHWAVPYYEAAKSAGYFSGRRIEKGHLGLPMSREHTAHITAGILRAEGGERWKTLAARERTDGENEAGQESGWSDIGEGFLYADDAELARAAGILKGYPDGSFGPLRTLTRAEAACVLCGIAAFRETDEGIAEAKQEQGVESGKTIVRQVKKKDRMLPVRYKIREVSANDLGILRIEIIGEHTVRIQSAVRYPFIKMMREDGSLRKSIVFPDGTCLEKEGCYFYAADPDGENMEGSIPYLLLEDESREVYCLTDLRVTRAETAPAKVTRANRV